jgi:tRNA A37 threonylcarbamoyladenosine synthetase subunit TsaC/SUA5/YrdC
VAPAQTEEVSRRLHLQVEVHVARGVALAGRETEVAQGREEHPELRRGQREVPGEDPGQHGHTELELHSDER